MKTNRSALFCVALVFLMVLISTVHVYGANEPMDAVKEPVDQLISILKDPAYTDGAKMDEQRDKLWTLIKQFFDFKTMSRLTLATKWKNFSPDQQKEFVDVFADFLAGIYLNRIQGEFEDETVTYLEQKLLTKKKALVKTTINRKTTNIPVFYRMYHQDSKWLAYDVIIEKVSLVRNYRAQFKQFLRKGTPEELMKQLREKTEENKTKKAEK